MSAVIEENPTKYLDLSDFPKLSKSNGVLRNMRAIALHHVFGRRKPIEARYRAFFFLNGVPFPYCAYYINGVGSVMKPFGQPNEDHHEEAQGYCAHLAFRVELVLTLLNTRNSPFTDFRDPELDRKKQQIKTMTAEERKAYLLRLRKRNASLGEVIEKVVTIDLAPMKKQKRFRNMSNRQIMDIIRRHFVRAHFKWLKEKGPTLWRFHLRGKNKPGETDADLMAQEAVVIASNPATPLQTPDGRVSFGRAIRQKGNANTQRRIKGRNGPRPGR